MNSSRLKSLFGEKIERPLANAHWLLLAVLIALGILMLLYMDSSCIATSTNLIYAWITFAVLVLAWSNHLMVHPLDNIEKILKFTGYFLQDFCVFLLLAFLVSLPLAIILPTYDCITPRVKAGEIILSASMARTEIADRFAQSHTLEGSGVGVRVEEFGRLAYTRVMPEGTIILVGKDPAIAVVFEPFLQKGKLEWKCKGYPENAVPASCRDR